MFLKSGLLSLLPRNPFQSRIRDVRQGEMAECGLAALVSLMSFYGAPVTLDRLRVLAASTLYGTSLRTLHQVAIQLGFEARVHRVEHVADLAEHAPCVVHLSFIHFAVVEKISREEVLLSDPLAGPKRMPVDRFSREFTGIVLTLRPTRFLRRFETAPQPSRRSLLTGRGRWIACGAAAGSGGMLSLAANLAVVQGAGGGTLAAAVAALVMAFVFMEAAIRLITRSFVDTADTELAASIAHVAAQPPAAFVLRAPTQTYGLLSAPAALRAPVLADAMLAGSVATALLVGALVTAPLIALGGALMLGAEFATLAALTLWRGKAVPHLRWNPMPVRTPYADELARADGWALAGGSETLFRRLAGTHALAAEGAMPGAERGAMLAGLRAGFAGTRLLVLLLIGLALIRAGVPASALFAAGVLVMIAGSQLARVTAALRTPDVTAALHRLADRTRFSWGAPPAEPPPGMALVCEAAAWRAATILPDVVQEVSFNIPSGGSLAIIAAPRTGSTVIARLAAGWIAPTRGVVRAGRSVLLTTRWPFAAGRLRDLLAPPGELPDAILIGMIDAVGLGKSLAPRGGLELRLTAGAPELSGGQRRRVMVAAALLARPELLVLDGTLEAVGTASAAELLALCCAQGTAVLLTGHRADIAALCDAAYHHGALAT